MSDMTLAPEEVREATWGWWLLLLIGALSIAAGVIVIAKPSNSLSVLAVVAGIFVLLDGIFEIAYSLRRGNENRGAVAVLGVLSAIIGIMLIRHPINGVTAEGTRITHTIAAGQIGNDKPIQIVFERWYSPDLQVVVKSMRSDPRFGTTTYTLSKVQRAEPAASLFTVPSDYTVQQGGHGRRAMSTPPPGPGLP